MRTRLILTLVCALIFTVASAVTLAASQSQDSFWTKFKTAVIGGDKETIALLSQFPIDMPYGVPSVRTKAQLIKRYRQVFNGEANATKCFAGARPESDPARPREFTVACDNGSGEKVIIYRFVLTKTGWRFKGLDNINE